MRELIQELIVKGKNLQILEQKMKEHNVYLSPMAYLTPWSQLFCQEHKFLALLPLQFVDIRIRWCWRSFVLECSLPSRPETISCMTCLRFSLDPRS